MQLQLPFECDAQGSADSSPPDLRFPGLKPAARPGSGFDGDTPGGPPRIEFVRMRRARRYILRVAPDGSLRVTVPRGGSRREAEAFVAQQRRWVECERRRIAAEHAPPQWHPGDRILLRGRPVTIRLVREARAQFVTYGERRILLPSVDGSLREAIEADLRTLAEAELLPALAALAGRHGLEPARVSIRNQRSRWGSCGRSGNIALNFRLVQMPPAVCEYVLVHELMHLRQQNHSRRFWRLVQAACPNFRDAERWLRTTGRTLF